MLSRLPAVKVEALPPRTSDFLPRMDIPLFVGFAQKGSLSAVLVQDMVQFKAEFGEAQVLCWNDQDGSEIRMQLAGTVRAFFENGGRQCYVLRVNPDGVTHEDEGAQWGFNLQRFQDARLDARDVRSLALQVDSWRLASRTPQVGFQGIHKAIELPDVAFISVPDAVHAGWVHRVVFQVSVVTPPAPVPEVVPDPVPPPGAFEDCEVQHTPILTAPFLKVTQDHEKLVVSFVPGKLLNAVGVVKHVLQIRSDTEVRERLLQPGLDLVLTPADLGVGFFDLQVVASCPAPVLNTVGNPVRVRVRRLYRAFQKKNPPREDLLELHRSMLLTCAFRADTLAILSVPALKFGALVRHAARLRSLVPSGTERYGSLYAPLLRQAEQVLVPDGVVLGQLSEVALTRGSWVAAANRPYRDVTGVEQEFSDAQRLQLQEARINVGFLPPAGILHLSALVLSLEEPHQNVRLLLHLLRRYLDRLGSTFVFEPNTQPSRLGMKRQLEDALEVLFKRGAFRGRTPQESYQVAVLTAPENTLLFEIRVNPSVPMTHLTVTLVQAEDGWKVQE
ncbi:hypothetical protein [Deinococcus roseus]|uniref:Tail sheath protein subtilisin-like domain-containing protein n=1 Tax=Deinococcus roseus TaxID=392414 RepID=A0ABQ2D075_9DEIO|nr:hypothetical protein [Deinococcus roseus]GGJ33463.1 hypothetical protein GCM10008938_19620 [Deinococcus roseus]